MAILNKEPGMTFIVKTVTRLTLSFILLYGFYISLHGNVSPGGGFAGGVIVALSFVHIMLAFGKETALRMLNLTRLRVGAGVAALILLAVIAIPGNLRFQFIDPEIIISLCDMVIVAFGLFGIFITLLFVVVQKKNRA